MRVVVTGGAGFIGANVARVLAPDHQVVVLDDLSTGLEANLHGLDVTLHVGSMLERPALDAAFEGADAIVHLAARPSVPRSMLDPVGTHQANASGTLEVLEAARRAGAGHILVASSSSVYGANPRLPKHEGLLPAPVSPYAASKLAAESYALAYARSFGLDVLVFRFFNVFGPLQRADHPYAAVVPIFATAALAGRDLPIHGDGRQSRDFTYVDSLCAVVSDALARRVSSPTPVNLAFGTRRTLLDVVTCLEACIGHPLRVEHLPQRDGDVRASQADQTRLRSLFPTVDPVDFTTGLEATVSWLRTATAP